MSDNNPFRPKARRPRGFEDKSAAVIRAERRLIEAAVRVYDAFGFEPLDTPAFEYADALGKFLPDEERPNEGVFALQDDDGQWMALRYDLTAPLARYVAENFQHIAKPFRRYQTGEVWRNEKPGPGRFRQFIQCDADSVGAASPAADAEMIAMAADVMRAAGLKDGEYMIRVNDRRILDGVLESIGAGRPDTRMRVLRAIDKLDRLGREGVEQLLGAGRKDESGDFTEGAGLDAKGAAAVLAFIDAAGGGRADVLAALSPLAGNSEAGRAGLAALAEIDACLTALGAGEGRAVFDPSVVRGLGYYTGPVFEAELLTQASYADGSPMRFGSVGGGGRYDDLVARFTGQTVPATGFSFGVSRFAAALAALGYGETAEAPPLAVVLTLDREYAAESQAMAAELRAAGLRAEAHPGGGNMGKQLKYADRREAAVAVIVGGDERAAGQVTIKNLRRGAALSDRADNREDWLKQQAEQAQITVARAEMTARVLEMTRKP